MGNIGKEKGSIWWSLAAAYAVYPFSMYLEDETTWFSLMSVASSLAFDHLSKEWRRKPRKKRDMIHRVTILSTCGFIYLTLLCSCIFFNGKLTDSDGEEIPIQEAFTHFFTSPWWVDLNQCLYDTYIFAQHHGFYEIWQQIIDLSDPHGEINAYKVLGVDLTSSQSEITSKWRALSKEFHPDKVKNPDLKAAAQDKFMEIQQAYEILSKIKARRKSKNKKFHKNPRHKGRGRHSIYENLCKTLIDVPVNAPNPVCESLRCKYLHDVNKFLQSKPPDIGNECNFFNKINFTKFPN